MELITNAVLVKDMENIEIFQIKVNENNYIKVRKKLEFEKFVISCILKDMKEKKEIKSVWNPRNKKIQPYLDKLIRSKRIIDNSIDKIREFFYKNR